MKIGCKECGNSDAGHYLGVLFHKDDCNARRRKMFSKRHYQAIADVIKVGKQDIAIASFSLPLVIGLIEMFERDNPKFDRVRFLDACGLGIAKPAISAVERG